jgi:hypothetical protein
MSGKPEAISTERERPETNSTSAAATWGWGFLVACLLLFAVVTLPVIVNGAPLHDDFGRCVDPGKADYWQDQWELQGLFRPATTLEIVVTNGLCGTVPFGLVILIPWLLTIGVAFLTKIFLRDIGVPSPWSEIGAGLWLLAPLGTETALWPATLHVTLGLGLALMALMSFHKGNVLLGAALGLGSYLSVEQAILALPLAAFMVSPQNKRMRALTSSVVLSVGVLVVYSQWGGTDFGLAASFPQRIENVFRDVEEYAIMPAIGLGVQSVTAAVRWAFPISVLVLALCVTVGWTLGPKLLRITRSAEQGLGMRHAIGALALLVLINLPVALQFPHEHSPRVFTPTWLALAIFVAIAGSRIHWRRPRLAGAAAGGFIAGALLSLALSSWVRIETSSLDEEAMKRVAAETPDGGVVAVCGRTRTLVQPAPYGDFSTHEFNGTFTDEAYEYYTGNTAEIRVGGYAAGSRCPDTRGADVVLEFHELMNAQNGSGSSESR